MEDRLVRLEEALEQLRADNRELRQELNELRAQVSQAAQVEAPDQAPETAPWWRSRWMIAVLGAVIVIVPVALMLGHVSAFWTTVIGTINAFFIYLIGPGLVRLLAEGLIRAIPAVLLGQSARIYLDKKRLRKMR